jgi:ribonuclease P protein component
MSVADSRPQTPDLRLPKKLHLRAKADFDAVFDARTRESAGPLAFHARRNDLPISRFGMSVSRKVGTAVQRNRIRRKLRESFRLLQHDLPKGYDVVVVVRPHAPLELVDYQRLMRGSLQKLDATWKRRSTKRPESPASNG